MTTSTARLCSDLNQFKQLTQTLCHQNPGENTRLIAHINAANNRSKKGESLAYLRMIIVEQSGSVVAAAINNPKGLLGLSQMDETAALLLSNLLLNASEFAGHDFPIEIAGPTPAVKLVIERGNFRYQIKYNLTLHELIGSPMRGRSNATTRLATAKDQPTVVHWLIEFFKEINETPSKRKNAVSDVQSGIATANFIVALDEHQDLAGMAHATQLPFDCARIGPVYTAPRYRGKGIAQAVVADASTYARQRGAQRVFLFTDQSNPASNIAYQRIGYQSIEEHLHVALANPF